MAKDLLNKSTYSKKEIAQYLGVSERSIGSYIAKGKLKAYKLGDEKQSPIIIKEEDLNDFLERSGINKK